MKSLNRILKESLRIGINDTPEVDIKSIFDGVITTRLRSSRSDNNMIAEYKIVEYGEYNDRSAWNKIFDELFNYIENTCTQIDNPFKAEGKYYKKDNTDKAFIRNMCLLIKDDQYNPISMFIFNKENLEYMIFAKQNRTIYLKKLNDTLTASFSNFDKTVAYDTEDDIINIIKNTSETIIK